MKTPQITLLKYEALCGSNINNVIKHIIGLAKLKSCCVETDFNGVTILATPDSTEDYLYSGWRAAMDKAAEDYRNSPEGIKAARDRENRKTKNQAIIDTLISQLPDILRRDSIVPHKGIMHWLKLFVDPSDYIGVNYDKGALIQAFISAGYKENEGVGESKEYFEKSANMAKYIMGQVINCLKHGMGPHQVTLRFIDDYFKLLKAETDKTLKEVFVDSKQ